MYFAIVFSVAFLFGIARTLWLTPAVGAIGAVCLEVSVVVAVSVGVARRLMRGRGYRRSDAAMIGVTAFALLMLVECALAALIFAQSPGQWAAAVFTPAGLIGLGGQVMFGLMPVIVRRSAA
jgi:hypothetical protein